MDISPQSQDLPLLDIFTQVKRGELHSVEELHFSIIRYAVEVIILKMKDSFQQFDSFLPFWPVFMTPISQVLRLTINSHGRARTPMHMHVGRHVLVLLTQYRTMLLLMLEYVVLMEFKLGKMDQQEAVLIKTSHVVRLQVNIVKDSAKQMAITGFGIS